MIPHDSTAGSGPPSASQEFWTVYRLDDNGNRFVVETRLSHANALRIIAELESHGHKQTYWIERDLKT